MRASALPVVALVVAVVTAGVAAPAVALGADDGIRATTADGTNATNDSLAPGQRLAGVVGVQGAEIDGEVETRALSARVARADSNASKAGAVATELDAVRERLDELEERKAALRNARRTGEMPPGEYRARLAVTEARIRSVEARLNATEDVANDLPDEALAAKGVDRNEVDSLRNRASDLRGPEVARIARDLAGPPGDAANRSVGGGPPADVTDPGPPTTARNATATGGATAPPDGATDDPSESGSLQ